MSTVLVTGGGRGIGRAIALAFAEPGATVVIADLSRADLDATGAAIEQRGAAPVPLVLDVCDEASVAGGFQRVRESIDRLDVLVNNAGIGGEHLVEHADAGAWRRVIETNLVGAFLVTRQAIPLLARGGRVVNMASIAGRIGVPGYTAYCASKHGVVGFTRALALELADRQITVNAVCPGWVDTEMAALGMRRGAQSAGITVEEFTRRALGRVPIGRIIQPEEVASLVRFLASPQASAITGQSYNICGGQSMD